MGNVIKRSKERTIYLDLLRIIAILMVLYNHRATYTLANYFAGINIKYIVLAVLAVLCRCGAPLFFMVSGALLLGKEESFSYILRHRVLKLLVMMIVCALIVSAPEITLVKLIDAFFLKLNWYLYAYVDYLLMLPILRLVAKNASASDIKIYFILTTVLYTLSGILIYFEKYIAMVDFIPIYNTPFASTCWSIIFSLSGYFLNNFENVIQSDDNNVKQCNKLSSLLKLGAVFNVTLSVILVTADIVLRGGNNIDQLRLHSIYLPCCCIFLTCKKMVTDWKIFRNKIIINVVRTVAGATYGIFILETHSQLINYINWKMSPVAGIIGEYRTALLAICIQFAVCFCITYVLKRIPLVKKIL